MGCHSKFAKCSVVIVEVFSNIMQELIAKPISAASVYKIINNNDKFISSLCTRKEIYTIQSLMTDGFSKLDVSLIYKICKYFNFIPSPSRFWGAFPSRDETSIGDDVERIRIARNDFVHRTNCDLEDSEFEKFFNDFVQLGKRVDDFLGKSEDSGFQKDILYYYNTSTIDDYMESKYIRALQDIEKLKEKARLKSNYGEKIIIIHYGRSMEELIETINEEAGSSPTPVKIIIKGIDGTQEQAALLNSLGDQLSDVNIQFKQAWIGSLVLHVLIRNTALKDLNELAKYLTCFLERVFSQGNVDTGVKNELNIVLSIDDDEIDSSESVQTEERHSDPNGKHSLILDLEVHNITAQGGAKFEDSIGKFLEKVITKTNGTEVFPEKEVTAIISPGAWKSGQHMVSFCKGEDEKRKRLTRVMDNEQNKSFEIAPTVKAKIEIQAETSDKILNIYSNALNIENDIYDTMSCRQVQSRKPIFDTDVDMSVKIVNTDRKPSFENMEVDKKPWIEPPPATHLTFKKEDIASIENIELDPKTSFEKSVAPAGEMFLKFLNIDNKYSIENIEVDQKTSSKQVTKSNGKTEQELLSELSLDLYFPNKISLSDCIKIHPANTDLQIGSIPWLFLENLILLNFNARDKIIEELLEMQKGQHQAGKNTMQNFDNFLREEESLDRINPLDLTIALLKCCAPVVKQMVASKMFMCRLAIPFIFPETRHKHMSISLWPIRTIVIERETPHINAVDCPCNVVSFIRFGHQSVSKSKLINEIITDSYHSIFFNKDSPLGTTTRCISDGLVEIAWYIPSPKTSILKNVTVCLNLRGNCDSHKQQLEILSHLSDVITILVDIKELLTKQFIEFLKMLYETRVNVVLSIDAKQYSKDGMKVVLHNFFKEIKKYEDRTKIAILAVDGNTRSIAFIKKDIRRNISELLERSSPVSLYSRIHTNESKKVSIDENEEVYRSTSKAADKITNFITKMQSKENLLPLQGQPWKEWSQNLKTVNKSSKYKSIQEKGLIKNKMSEARETQFHMCENLCAFMGKFIHTIQKFLPKKSESTVFVAWLKYFFDERSREILPEYLARYKTKWQELKSAQHKKDNTNSIETLRKELDQSEIDLAEASFGFEHLCREMGQIYEALMESTLEIPARYKTFTSILPEICAKLLISGHAFEVMDGDTANVPLVWVKAVLEKLKEIIGDKKMLALSVLGIQDSGKSTLLNTMFGLNFAVSAGRCTRGVFMQLVPVQDESKPFDYVLVLDSEGLRATELALKKYMHDNELATFVIGLGDVTIVNLKGGSSSEVHDVLQIAITAFLRLKLANKRLNLKQKCIFVHQNVSATDATDKMMQQRKKFTEVLDNMTQEAAAEINIADINSFDEVLDFDSEENVWYFSDLWYGDPPMAPANPGYSECVKQLKDAVMLCSLNTQRKTFLTITDTMSRMEDLWTGILKDDFIFSFRSSIELKAYNNMERQWQSLTWSLEKYVMEFVMSEAKGVLANCMNNNEIEKASTEIGTRLSLEASNRVNELCNDLDSFVERSTLKDFMVQWKQTKEARLRLFADNLVSKAIMDINTTKEESKIQQLQIRENIHNEMQINELATKYAIEMQGKTSETDKLEKEFNLIWNSWISQLSLKDDVEVVSIADLIENLVYEKFSSDAAFFQQRKKIKLNCSTRNLRLRKLENSIRANSISDEYFSKLKSLSVRPSETFDNCKRQTVEVINKTFRKIDARLSDLESTETRFNISYVTEIMNIIINDIEEHNEHKTNNYKFNLLPTFRAMIVKTVERHLTTFFTRLDAEYNKKHSPKAQMEMYKETAWAFLKNVINQKTEEAIAAEFFKEAIIKATIQQVTQLLPLDVQEHIIGLFSNTKLSLMKSIMIYLANADNFDLYQSYIRHPSSFAKSWISKLTDKELFEPKGKESAGYVSLAKRRIHQIFCQLSKRIEKATDNWSRMKHSSISQWINIFLQDVGDWNHLPMSKELLIHVQQRRVSDISNFSKTLLDDLKDGECSVLKHFQKTTSRTIQWHENPIDKIISRLWGCTAKCFFCHEPCKNTDKDHVGQGFPHQCIQHRPEGIKGMFWLRSKKLGVDFCNHSISTSNVYKLANGTWKYFRDYKNELPDWDIFPSSDVSEYWIWVFCKYRDKLVALHNKDPPDIPVHWWKIDKEKAILSLNNHS